MSDQPAIPELPHRSYLPEIPRIPSPPTVPEVSGRRAADPGPPDDLGAVETSDLFRILAEAIDREQVVAVHFGGETDVRRICPDRSGIDVHDQFQVEAFQLSGPSASDTGTNHWKCFHLRDLEVVGVEPEGWRIGPRATTAGSCFHHVVHPTPGTQ
jgi:hypothetical protein